MLKAIWAQSCNGIIGDGATMPWHVPEDLQHFKQTTLGEPVIMGRKTWESLPVKPLPRRANFILSRRNPGPWSAGAEVIHTIPDTGWIIGGGEVYAATIDRVQQIERTLIDVPTAALPPEESAVFAPELGDEFTCSHVTDWQLSRSGLRYRFETWQRG